MTGEGANNAVSRRRQESLRESPRFNEFEVLGILTSGIAHDFNNLLIGIHECVELALDPSTTRELARQSLEETRGPIARGRRLVEQLLAFARGEPRNSAGCVLDDTVRQCTASVERLLSAGTRLVVELDAEGVRVPIDAGPLEQIMLNLCSNASNAMPEGGRLVITTRLCDHPPSGARTARSPRMVHAELTVRDTGTGMSEVTLSRAMEPFFTTKTDRRGMGLGLSTVFGIARYAGGRVELESSTGKGTTVRVELPVIASP